MPLVIPQNRVITPEGAGELGALAYGSAFLVKVDGEERPFTIERREILELLPCLVLQVAAIGGIYLASGFFCTEDKCRRYIETITAANEVNFIVNLVTGKITANQDLELFFDEKPIVYITSPVGVRDKCKLESFPREDLSRQLALFDELTRVHGGSGRGIFVDFLADFEAGQVLAIRVIAGYGNVFAHTYVSAIERQS